jgi:branched-chain amino acid transport system permease protein
MPTVILSGIAVGCIYAMVALGVNVAYLPSKIFNLAHPQLVVLGAFLSYSALVQWHWSWPAALIFAAVIPGLAAALIEIVVMQLGGGERSGSHSALVSTLGIGIAIQAVSSLIWKENPLAVPSPLPGQPVHFGSATILPDQILVIVLAFALAVVYEWIVRKTKPGLRYRAVAEDSVAASARGISVRRTLMVSFVAAGLAAGVTGFVIVPITFVYPEFGNNLLLEAFVALAVGGFGSQAGALGGGVFLGLAEAIGAYYWGSNYPDIIPFAVLILALTFRPAGIFGARRLRTV